MAFGNQIAEFKSKTSTRTVIETTPTHIRAQFNNEGMVSGKLNGMIMYTVRVTQYADGTGIAETEVAIMGPEGEMASGRGHALGLIGPGGKVLVRGIMALHSENPKWSWLNHTPIAVEANTDMQSGEEIGRMFEWK